MTTTTSTTELDSTTRAEAVIREFLSRGDSKGALNEAVHELRARLADLRHPRRGRPADGAHMDAQLAGMILALAAQASLHQHPDTFPGTWQGHHLLTAFQAAYEAATAHPGERE